MHQNYKVDNHSFLIWVFLNLFFFEVIEADKIFSKNLQDDPLMSTKYLQHNFEAVGNGNRPRHQG